MTPFAATRRALLTAGGLAVGALFLAGHTPYKQWVVYRQKHLLIGSHRADPRTYELANDTIAVLELTLPGAKARAARAPNAGRLASLLGTAQLDTAMLSRDDAVAMAEGSGAFVAFGPVALTLLVPVADRLLVARRDFPESHAFLVTRALAGTTLVPALGPPDERQPPWHPGSAAFLADEAMPSGGE